MKRITAGTVTVMMGAILFGLVAAYVVRSYLAKPAPKTVDVWVASVNLPKYARISENIVRPMTVPANQVPEGAIQDQGRVNSRLVSAIIEAGKPITEASLYPIDAEPTLNDQIPPGKRAVTISVTEETALAGVLMPNSLIDISLTAEPDHPEIDRAMTVTLVRGIQVLATSQHRHPYREKTSRRLRSITVAATPRQANKLILAQQYGSLNVTLRGSLEDLEDTVEKAPADKVAQADFHAVQVADDAEANPFVEVVPAAESEIKVPSSADNVVTPHQLLGLAPPKVRKQTTTEIWRGTSMVEVKFGEQPANRGNGSSRKAEPSRGSTKKHESYPGSSNSI